MRNRLRFRLLAAGGIGACVLVLQAPESGAQPKGPPMPGTSRPGSRGASEVAPDMALVRDLQDFPAALPTCSRHAMKKAQKKVSSRMIGRQVLLEAYLHTNGWTCTSTKCKGADGRAAGCCNHCKTDWLLTPVSRASTPIYVGRAFGVLECQKPTLPTVRVLSAGTLVKVESDVSSSGSELQLQDASMCVYPEAPPRGRRR